MTKHRRDVIAFPTTGWRLGHDRPPDRYRKCKRRTCVEPADQLAGRISRAFIRS